MSDGILIAVFVVVAAVLAWVMMGKPPIICRQPELTRENYVDMQIEARERGCLLIARDRQ